MSASPAASAPVAGGPSWLAVIAEPVRLQILRTLCEVSDATVSELAERGPASYQTLRRHLDALEALDVVRARPGVSDGGRSGRPATRFSLTPAVRRSVCLVFGSS